MILKALKRKKNGKMNSSVNQKCIRSPNKSNFHLIAYFSEFALIKRNNSRKLNSMQTNKIRILQGSKVAQWIIARNSEGHNWGFIPGWRKVFQEFVDASFLAKLLTLSDCLPKFALCNKEKAKPEMQVKQKKKLKLMSNNNKKLMRKN